MLLAASDLLADAAASLDVLVVAATAWLIMLLLERRLRLHDMARPSVRGRHVDTTRS